MKRLHFNYSLTDITPSEHLILGGFANRKGLSREIHRRLTSRCVALKQEEVFICLIVNDLMDVDQGIIQSIKNRIVQKTGMDIDPILITSIHTHSAPEMEYGRSEENDRYIKLVIEKISDNAARTITDKTGFKKANVKYGRSECDINIARRDIKPDDGGMAYRVGDQDGLRDEEVGILQFTDDSGNQKVILFNYACHPVTLGYESNYISTDYPGRTREIIEEKEGGMAVFMNGATGDLNPREAHFANPAKTDSVGERLGKAVLSAEMISMEDTDIKTIARTIWVPFRDQVITKEHISAEAKRKASDITEFFTWQKMLDRWERKVYEMIDKNEVKKSFPFKINIVKLGKAIIFFTQGELFVKYQLELKKRFAAYHVFCVSYVHGIGAYIPTADVFEKKGYEADQSYIYEVMPSPLSPKIEKIYLEGAVDAINELIK
jgi:neutral ceramidase